jgi:hypothetical protein
LEELSGSDELVAFRIRVWVVNERVLLINLVPLVDKAVT